jgi:alkylhydroperoxidase family enzyme
MSEFRACRILAQGPPRPAPHAARDRDSGRAVRRAAGRFDEGAIVEIMLVAGLFDYFNLVSSAQWPEPAR